LATTSTFRAPSVALFKGSTDIPTPPFVPSRSSCGTGGVGRREIAALGEG
jgi:hypothetical protein